LRKQQQKSRSERREAGKAATPAKKAAPAKKAPAKAAAKPAPKKAPAKAAPKPVAKKVVAKPAAKSAAPKKVLKPAPKPVAKATGKSVNKSTAKPVAKAAPKKAVPQKQVKPLAKKIDTKKAAPAKAAAPKAVPAAKAPAKAPVKAAPAKAAAPAPKAAEKAPVKATAPAAKAPAKPAVQKPVVLPKLSTKTARKYEPDFTKSVLDQTPVDPGAPVVMYGDTDLAEFRELIQRKLGSAKKELAYLQGLITRKDDMGGDEGDNRYMTMEDGSLSMEREQLSQMASRQITFIDHLEKALMRIENKTYGVCRVTGKLIDKARLRAVPHATLSIEAKMGSNK
jgi:RNA polymerase-binding transcription factor DksA